MRFYRDFYDFVAISVWVPYQNFLCLKTTYMVQTNVLDTYDNMDNRLEWVFTFPKRSIFVSK